MIKKIAVAFIVLTGLVAVFILKDKFKSEVTYIGTIEATKIDLPARLSTTVDRLLVSEGEHVEAQTPLIDLDCREIKIQEGAIEAEFNRSQRLFKTGSLPKDSFEKIEKNKAEINLKSSWCQISAPIKGLVTTIYTDHSEWVNPGAKVISIIDLDDVWTNIYVDQNVFPKLSIGMIVQAKIANDGKKNIQGKIIRLNPECEFTPKNAQTLKERSRLVHGVKIKLEQDNQLFKPGMPIEIIFSNLDLEK